MADVAEPETVDGEIVPDEQPSGSDLVAIDDAPENVLAVVDRHDEAMIVSELQRRALKVMLYAFPIEGKEVVDLSYLGVNEAVRLMNNSGKWRVTVDRNSLVVEDVIEDVGNGEPEPCFQATVYAVNELTGYGQFGTFTQPKRIKLRKARDGVDTIADKFARQKAVNKAQRNALRIHIPEELRQTIIAQYRGNPENVQRVAVGAGAEALADLPPPLTDTKARKLLDDAHKVYEELKALDAMAVPPGAFFAYRVRSEGSHELLEEFVAYLRDKLRQVQEALAKKEGS